MPKRRPDAATSSNRLVMSAKEARRKFRLRPTKETLDKIRKRNEAQSLAYERIQDMPLG